MSSHDDRRDVFTSISPSEFFYRNRQMAGFGNPVQAVYSTVRELVENSLDACDDAGVEPVVTVSIRQETGDNIVISCSDNGSGIPSEQVACSFGQVFYGSKYESRQRRGTFGLGVTMAVLYGQITTDMPVEIHTKTAENAGHLFRVFIDVEHNRPIVDTVSPLDRSENGTTVTLHIRGDLRRARERIIDYLRLSTIGTPHARFNLHLEGVGPLTLGPWFSQAPTRTTVMRPHPRSADPELLRRLIARQPPSTRIQNFLVESFQQIGERTAKRLLKFISMNASRPIGDLSREEILRLSNALRTFDGIGRPSAASLSPIGAEPMLAAVRALFRVDAAVYSCSPIAEWQGNPFLLEGVAAVGPDFSEMDPPAVQRFANRVPLLYDNSDCILTRAVREVKWSRYGLNTGPVQLFIHLCSTRVPYKATGKQSIASVPEIELASVKLYKDLGRFLGESLRGHERAARVTKRMRDFVREFRLVVKFGSELAETEPPDIDELVRRLFEVPIDEERDDTD